MEKKRFDEHTLQRIKDNTNLPRLMGRLGVPVKRIGSKFFVCCPFHQDKHASMLLNVGKYDNTARCFTCAQTWDVFGLVMKIAGTDYPTAVRIAAEDAGIIIGTCGHNIDTAERYSQTPAMQQSQEPAPAPVYWKLSDLTANCNRVEAGTLFQYLAINLPKFRAKTLASFRKYHVGTSSKNLMGIAATAFPTIGTHGGVERVKLVPYGEDGHRKHRPKDAKCADVYDHKAKNLPTDTAQYFGSHLLLDYPTDTPIAIVESEKSAVICSVFFPRFVWLATGGKSHLNGSRIEYLRGREIHLFPDKDALKIGERANWQGIADNLHADGFNITVEREMIDAQPDGSKFDIADIALDYFIAKVSPSQIEAARLYERMRVENPQLAEFCDKMECVPISVEPYNPEKNEPEK